ALAAGRAPGSPERLLAVARAGTAAHVERIVRGWRCVDRIEETRETARQHAGRGLHVYHDDDGMVVVRGRLEPEAGALPMQALSAAREALYQRQRRESAAQLLDPSSETPSMAQQQADALSLIAETAHHQYLYPCAPSELSLYVHNVNFI